METGTIIILTILIAFAIIAPIVIKRKRKQVEETRKQYEDALQSGDKAAALKAGREYYSLLRGGDLTIYDEQAIANDLSTMK